MTTAEQGRVILGQAGAQLPCLDTRIEKAPQGRSENYIIWRAREEGLSDP
jgi:hypothetical protein